MIRVPLSDDQRRELENFRHQASSKDSEKAMNVAATKFPLLASEKA